jgi:hypothetical protein
MKEHLRNKLLILMGSAALLLGSVGPVPGQFTGSRRVRVYNPGTYHRTRATMSRRAALRKHLRKKRRRWARRRRHNFLTSYDNSVRSLSTFEDLIARGLAPVQRLKAREKAAGSEKPTR